MYFDFFPTLEYTFSDGNTIEMVDIFRKVSFSQSTLTNDSIFDTFYVANGGSPEIVSFNLYGSSRYSWMLFAANRMINPHKNWPREYTSLITELNSKYNGKTYYICRIPDLLPGDVMIKITRSSCSGTPNSEIYTGCSFSYQNPIATYKIIKEWNQELRYIIGVGGSTEFSEGDTFAILRKNSLGEYKLVKFGNSSGNETIPGQDGFVDITIDSQTFTIFRIAKIVEEKNTIVNFFQGTIVASPYRKVSSLNVAGSLTNYYSYTKSNINTYQSTTPVFSDPDDFSGTVLDAYVRGVLPSAITYKTKLQLELEQNDKNYNVRTLKTTYLDGTISLFKQAINSNQGRVLSIELNA